MTKKTTQKLPQTEITGEFERTPVPISKLKSWKSFLGMYAGEHAAGTEFVIGPLFLTTGVPIENDAVVSDAGNAPEHTPDTEVTVATVIEVPSDATAVTLLKVSSLTPGI